MADQPPSDLQFLAVARALLAAHEAQAEVCKRMAEALRQLLPEPEADRAEKLTGLQRAILNALDGKQLSTDALAFKVNCGRSTLFKRGGVKELCANGRVVNRRGFGYYRPDRPPPETTET